MIVVHKQLAATVADMTSKLSCAAVFVRLLLLEEDRHEPSPFRDALERIEDHSQHGLYNILCRLHHIHQRVVTGDTSADLADYINSALTAVQLTDTRRAAYRHFRTISIVCDVAQLLQHFIVVLNSVIELFPLSVTV